MSAPAENMLPVPVRITTRASSRSLSASNRRINSSRVSWFWALTGGRSNTTVAIPSRSSSRKCFRSISFARNVGALDQLGQPCGIFREIGKEAFGRQIEDFRALCCQLGFHVGGAKHLLKGRGQSFDDVCRRAGREGYSIPRGHVEAGKAQLVQSRDIGELLRALEPHHRQRAQGPAANVREQRWGVEEAEIDLPRQHVDHGGSSAL